MSLFGKYFPHYLAVVLHNSGFGLLILRSENSSIYSQLTGVLVINGTTCRLKVENLCYQQIICFLPAPWLICLLEYIKIIL